MGAPDEECVPQANNGWRVFVSAPSWDTTNLNRNKISRSEPQSDEATRTQELDRDGSQSRCPESLP
jgi:hypothetical protein